MTNTEFNKIARRIKNAREYCSKMSKDDNLTAEEREDIEFFQDDIEKLIKDMCNYTCSVFDDNYKNANRAQMAEEYDDVIDFQRVCEDIERMRKNSHDALIIQIKVTDNACRVAGLEEIYGELPEEYRKDTSGLMGDKNRSNPGVVETRHAIADWCFDFVLAATVGMYMDLDELDYNKNVEDYKTVSEDFKYKRGGHMGAEKIIKEMTDPDL